MSDKTIIIAKEIEVVEKIEEANEEDTTDVKEEKHIATTTGVDISILNDENVVDKDNNQPKVSKYKKRREMRRAVSSVRTILYSIKQDISYRNNVGCKGTFILCLNLFLIGLNLYGFQQYGGFTCGMTNCPGTIFFFIYGLLNTLSFVYFILRWKAKVKRRIKIMSTPNFKSKNPIQLILKMYYTRFGLHGKYYLYKLYGSEMLEKISQTYNYIYIYTCILPYELTMFFSISYIIDSGILVKIMYKSLFGKSKIISAAERNNQLARDVAFDLICAITPLLIPYLVYGIPINVNEAILILLIPCMSLFGKIRCLFNEALLYNLDRLLIKRQNEESLSIKRNRKSMYQLSISEKEEKIQSKYFIKPVRQILLFIGIVHVLFFASIFFVQLSHGINLKNHDEICSKQYQNDNDIIMNINNNNNTTSKSDHNIWSNNGCKLKTPFCYSIFAPTCNCAYLSLESVNARTLPDNIVYDMTSLKKLEVVNCNLTTLPKNMENLKLITFVDLSYNKLTEFNVDIKEWLYLTRLYFQFNNISKYNMQSLWQHSALRILYANDNPNFVISNKVEIHMPMLLALDLRNNSMLLPNKFGKDQFPALLYLGLSGNNLNTFPENIDSLNNKLLQMWIARCQIYTLPSYLSTFKQLKYFDARGNNISIVDTTFQSIFYDENDKSKGDNNRRALFSGNPVCHTDINLKNSFSCEKMCSKYCWYKKEEVDQKDSSYCHPGCNSEECNHDQVDCVDNLQYAEKTEYTIL